MSAYTDAVLADDPFILYECNALIEGSLALPDTSGNDFHASWGGTPGTIGTTGPFGASLVMDENYNYIGVNAGGGGGDNVTFSANLWYSRTNPAASAGWDTMFGLSQLGAGLGLRLNGTAGAGGGAVDIFIQGVASILDFGVDIEDSEWHMYSWTKDGDDYAAYFDGELVGETTDATAFNPGGNVVRIGAHYNGSATVDRALGDIAMISFYTTPLGADRFAEYYELAFPTQPGGAGAGAGGMPAALIADLSGGVRL